VDVVVGVRVGVLVGVFVAVGVAEGSGANHSRAVTALCVERAASTCPAASVGLSLVTPAASRTIAILISNQILRIGLCR
jgi:hypothetical protein